MPTIHIVPHTHWDREWYQPAARFQLRLAHLVDGVLDAVAAGWLPSFLLDGQAVVLDDYAEARPERAPELARALRSGRLEAGPWYVLPDELTVSAEALVWNLMEGGRAVRRYGGRPLNLGYAPDAFGHSAALPTILAGFGIGTALVWRGFGGDRDLWRWRGPDGSEVLMIHLPGPGYEYGANLPSEPRAAGLRWRELAALLGPRARSPHWLVLNGADHHALQRRLKSAVAALNAVATGSTVQLSSLSRFASAVESWARRHLADLPPLEGELRAGWRHTWALQGTFGSRLDLKRSNAACQARLERVAGPLAALAQARGVDLRADLRATWRTLLANHPHDSICGTSTDEVHAEMRTRFARCGAQSDEVVARAADAVVGRDADLAREAGRRAWTPALLVFNPAPRARDAVVEAAVSVFRGDVPVGPGSAGTDAEPRRLRRLVLRDARGRALPVQILGARPETELAESSRHYPDCDRVIRVTVAVAARELPALGLSALKLEERAGPGRGPAVAGAVRVSEHGLENAHLWARVESDGTVALAMRHGGRSAHGLGALELMRDGGDAYTPSPRGRSLTSRPAAVATEVALAGPLIGAVEVARQFSGSAAPRQPMQVRLVAGARALELLLPTACAPGHRLRVAFPLGEPARRVVADGHFGPVERAVAGRRRRRAGESEAASPTAPMQRYVSVGGRRLGMTVFARGLPEYEVRPDGTVLVTLARAFTELARPDLPERPGRAGWPAPVLESVPEPWARQGELAVLLHAPAALDTLAEIEAEADRLFAAPVGLMCRALLQVPADVPGPMLDGQGLVLSTMKPAESGRGVVLRCYNATDAVVEGSWRMPWTVRRARLCRLDERPLGSLRVAGGRNITFTAGPRAVVTILAS